ncbi:hypothetical protein DL93DRAFT_361788 [Clavulina sp. PMI_390]|nr:hypothetical protein DL93DRAFT_361788 [Clavulina sp. PMI_390]
MAHVNLLPIEILRYIFTLTSLGPLRLGYLRPPYITGSTRSQLLTLPLAISSVCGYWRATAFSTGFLWSVMIVHIQSGDLQPSERDTAAITWQLQRVGYCPIDLIIEVTEYTLPTSSWDILTRLFPRCHSLTLTILASHYDHLFPLHDLMPDVKIISIYIIGSCSSIHLPILSAPSAAPCLEELRLHTLSPPMLETVPFVTLKHFQVESIHPQDFPALYEHLSLPRSLTSLVIPTTTTGDDIPYPPTPLQLPDLKTLTIEDCQLDRLINSPSLQHLSCLFYARMIDDSDVPLIQHLTLSHPIVKFDGVEPSTPPKWTQEVKTLYISHLDVNSISSLRAALCALKPREQEAEATLRHKFMYFPHLQELTACVRHVHQLESTNAQFVLRDLVAILEQRADLHLHYQGELVSRAGDQASDVFTPFEGRVSAVQ